MSKPEELFIEKTKVVELGQIITMVNGLEFDVLTLIVNSNTKDCGITRLAIKHLHKYECFEIKEIGGPAEFVKTVNSMPEAMDFVYEENN